MNPLPNVLSKCPRMRWAPLVLLVLAAAGSQAQNRLPTMPRFDRYEKMRREISGSVVRGAIQVRWEDEGKSFVYTWKGKQYRYDLAAKKATEISGGADPEPAKPKATPQQPARGRQFSTERSPDGKWTASYKDRNVWLKPATGDEIQVTTDGSVEKRIKNGIASWVYGEELGVRNAMWFSKDSSMLAYYRFDESKVPDFYLTMEVGKVQDSLDVEAYPKAGAPNPEVQLFVYDLASKKSVPVDCTFGPDGQDIAHYVYSVRWSEDGKELLFNRTNRKQNKMEICAADPKTGKCRVILREEQPQSWTDNSPRLQYLAPQEGKPQRFILVSERNGWDNIYQGDMSGAPLKAITKNVGFEVQRIVRVDEKAGVIWYMARDGDTPYRFQLHRIGLDGKGDVRLTDPKFHHSVDIAPDGKSFVDIIETREMAPATRVCDASGKVLTVLAESDLTKFDALGLKPGETFKYKAMDGVTDCYGSLYKPSDFDPKKKYPMIVTVYGGPESGGGAETFATPSAWTEFGFLVASFDGRGTSGRGKAFKDAVYGKLGIVEIDDQAAGVIELAKRPYVDGNRVGITGTSYGGYSSCMAILRYPKVFQASVASSSVTAWYHYDSIYTERYMGLPWESENKAGYDEGSAMKYAANLTGYLLLYYGTADNNVHPNNTFQLIQALNQARRAYDAQVGVDAGHSGVNQDRMLEYFIEHLVLPYEPKAGKEVRGLRSQVRGAEGPMSRGADSQSALLAPPNRVKTGDSGLMAKLHKRWRERAGSS